MQCRAGRSLFGGALLLLRLLYVLGLPLVCRDCFGVRLGAGGCRWFPLLSVAVLSPPSCPLALVTLAGFSLLRDVSAVWVSLVCGSRLVGGYWLPSCTCLLSRVCSLAPAFSYAEKSTFALLRGVGCRPWLLAVCSHVLQSCRPLAVAGSSHGSCG